LSPNLAPIVIARFSYWKEWSWSARPTEDRRRDFLD